MRAGRARLQWLALTLLPAAGMVGLQVRSPQVARASDPGVTHHPNLRPNPAYDLRVTHEAGLKLLRFSTAMANRGRGPLELFPVNDQDSGVTQAFQRLFTHDAAGNWYETGTQLIGTFSFHPEHDHWHFEDFASYRLRDVAADGSVGSTVLTSSEKVGFCLVDGPRVETIPEPSTGHEYIDCGPGATVGISAGFADVYTWGLPGQHVDVTGLPDGNYWLQIMADPANAINEGGPAAKADNSSFVKFRLSGDEVLPPGPDPLPGGGRLEEDDPAVQYAGDWYSNTFTGTGVRWIGYRDEWAGIARVQLDGQPIVSVDTYASPAQFQALLYSAQGLADGVHTLAIEATGTRNQASAGEWIWLDAFEVTSLEPSPSPSPTPTPPPPPPPGASRIEESDSTAVSYTGDWFTNLLAGHREGGAVLSMEAGARATLVFTGTGVSWIGYRDEWSGIARVYLDGVQIATVDTYASPAQYQAVLPLAEDLAFGTHTLAIEVSGEQNPLSGGAWVWVDAFEVTNAGGP
jgi:hypothetical protein